MQVLALDAVEFQVLLPVNMVAQIVGRGKIIEQESAIRGSLGKIKWREYEVPLFLTPQLFSKEENIERHYERIVMLWPMKTAGNLGFMAMTSVTAPRVIDIFSQPAIQKLPDLDYMLSAMALENSIGIVPDIDRLSEVLFNSRENENNLMVAEDS